MTLSFWACYRDMLACSWGWWCGQRVWFRHNYRWSRAALPACWEKSASCESMSESFMFTNLNDTSSSNRIMKSPLHITSSSNRIPNWKFPKIPSQFLHPKILTPRGIPRLGADALASLGLVVDCKHRRLLDASRRDMDRLKSPMKFFDQGPSRIKKTLVTGLIQGFLCWNLWKPEFPGLVWSWFGAICSKDSRQATIWIW